MRRWNPELEISLYNEVKDTQNILGKCRELAGKGKFVDFTVSALEVRARKLLKGDVPAETNEKTEEAIETLRNTVKDFVELYKSNLNLTDKYSIRKAEATAKIETKDPIIFLPLADFHTGHIAVDLPQVVEFIIEIATAKNLYIGLLGDYAELFFLPSDVLSIYEQYLSPNLQIKLWGELLKPIADKVLFAITASGHQHDAMIPAKTGFTPLENMFTEIGIDCLYNTAKFTLFVNEIPYALAVSHKPLGASMYNKCHSAHRLLQQLFRDCDIGVTAHRHEPAMLIQEIGGKTEHLIQCGTFKTGKHDVYSHKFWASKSLNQYYCNILFPEEKIIKTVDLDTARAYLIWHSKNV